MSIHVGLNSVSPTHYDGWAGRLAPCENDAKDMAAIARKQGFSPTVLLTRRATVRHVTSAIAAAAAKLRRGDILLVSYSGHGGQVPDENAEEGDGDDETWCLFDRELVDDELYQLWSRFEEGVRILVVSDSCHSGSVLKAIVRSHVNSPRSQTTSANPQSAAVKAIPRDVAWKTYLKNRTVYQRVQKTNPKGDRVGVGASVLLISACQDNQEARAGYPNSAFTRELRAVWGDGSFRGGHRNFALAIGNRLPRDMSPNFYRVGAANPVFDRQRPFTI